MAINRKQAFVNAAKARGIIIAATKTEALSMPAILEMPEIVALNMKTAAVQACVYTMVKNGLLNKHKDGLAVRYGGTTSTPAKISEPRAKNTAPQIKVDLIKATGRVRLTISGISIDIGVE